MPKKSNLFVSTLAAGTIVGLIVGMVIAPGPGKITRQLMADRAVRLRAKASDYVNTLRQKMHQDANTHQELTADNEHAISAD